MGADEGGVSVSQGELVCDAGVRRNGNNGKIRALSRENFSSRTRGGLTDNDVSVDFFYAISNYEVGKIVFLLCYSIRI